MKVITKKQFAAIKKKAEEVRASFPKNHTILARNSHDETIRNLLEKKGTETEIGTLKEGDVLIYYATEYYKKSYLDFYKSTRKFIDTLRIKAVKICPKTVLFTLENEETIRIPNERILGVVR